MFGINPKIANFFTVKKSALNDAGSKLIKTTQLQKDVFVSSKTTPKVQMTVEEIENALRKFFKNDEFEIRYNNDIFSNLDKIDTKNAKTHLKNLFTLLSGSSNNNRQIMQNGYFSSDEGAKAFELLADFLDCRGKKGLVSPLSIALADYTPETVLILKKRGLLNFAEISNAKRLNKLARMSDEEYSLFQKRVIDNIASTNCTYEELIESLKKDLLPLMGEDRYKYFEELYINKESIVQQIEIFKFLKSFPFELDKSSLMSILADVDIDNVDSFKNIIPIISKRTDFSQEHLSHILRNTNPKTEKIITDILQEEDIPIEKIAEYCKGDDFKQGLLSKEKVLEKINNDPFVKTIKAINSSSVDLTPKNTVQQKLDPQNISPDSLALVHLTDYEPENGFILSTRDKLGGSRNSVHFTLNHPVASHRAGYWDDRSHAIIMPYNSTVKLNGTGKFIEGMPNDIYTNGSVKIPEGSIILKHNPELQSGTINITDHPYIKGVKTIETSELPHDIVPTVIKKMGYTHLEANGPIGLFSHGANNGKTIDEAMDNFVAWSNFCKQNGIKATRHTGSAGDIAEKTIENVSKLCVDDCWIDRKNGKDYRKVLLSYIDFAKKLQQKGYFVSYDLDVLKTIIKNSPTPKIAESKIYKELGFHSTLKYDSFNDYGFQEPLNLYSEWYSIEDSLSGVREFLKDKEMIFLK